MKLTLKKLEEEYLINCSNYGYHLGDKSYFTNIKPLSKKIYNSWREENISASTKCVTLDDQIKVVTRWNDITKSNWMKNYLKYSTKFIQNEFKDVDIIVYTRKDSGSKNSEREKVREEFKIYGHIYSKIKKQLEFNVISSDNMIEVNYKNKKDFEEKITKINPMIL